MGLCGAGLRAADLRGAGLGRVALGRVGLEDAGLERESLPAEDVRVDAGGLAVVAEARCDWRFFVVPSGAVGVRDLEACGLAARDLAGSDAGGGFIFILATSMLLARGAGSYTKAGGPKVVAHVRDGEVQPRGQRPHIAWRLHQMQQDLDPHRGLKRPHHRSRGLGEPAHALGRIAIHGCFLVVARVASKSGLELLSACPTRDTAKKNRRVKTNGGVLHGPTRSAAHPSLALSAAIGVTKATPTAALH